MNSSLALIASASASPDADTMPVARVATLFLMAGGRNLLAALVIIPVATGNRFSHQVRSLASCDDNAFTVAPATWEPASPVATVGPSPPVSLIARAEPTVNPTLSIIIAQWLPLVHLVALMAELSSCSCVLYIGTLSSMVLPNESAYP